MNVNLTRKAKKQLSRLPKHEQKKVTRKLGLLEQSPFLGKALSGQLSGIYSLRVWPYRILYLVDTKQKLVTIITVRHRQGTYKT